MELLKVSYEIDKLVDLVKERERLISVLKIKPSAADNLNLKTQLNGTLDLLQSSEGAIDDEDYAAFEGYCQKYNEALECVPQDGVIDKSLYAFERRHWHGQTTKDISRSKRVRFKDDLIEYSDTTQDSGADVDLDADRIKLFEYGKSKGGSVGDSNLVVAPQLSNQEIFVQQQQQLLEQDAHLNNLSSNISRVHHISLDIDHELSDQNVGVLRDLESLVDTSGRNLSRARTRLDIYEKAARENGPCLVILLLTIILILLLIVI
ncbi:LAMI_0F06876g1_1 [Lachancea mirantina]|uniref:LAMI_0F06876g1_1 n=1 Tax=Lachancea mirantina TaxID=1230905 RepID=A0A1G4JZB0_9SACH|nr:LAMI_0F06876g1_1 [Lachancea mirantina]